jgi:hypothetical protein
LHLTSLAEYRFHLLSDRMIKAINPVISCLMVAKKTSSCASKVHIISHHDCTRTLATVENTLKCGRSTSRSKLSRDRNPDISTGYISHHQRCGEIKVFENGTGSAPNQTTIVEVVVGHELHGEVVCGAGDGGDGLGEGDVLVIVVLGNVPYGIGAFVAGRSDVQFTIC